MNSALDPYVAYVCGATPPYFASWYARSPAVAVGPDGTGYLAHSPWVLRRCTASMTNGTYQPPMGRLVVVPP